jgi:hypothetical protein
MSSPIKRAIWPAALLSACLAFGALAPAWADDVPQDPDPDACSSECPASDIAPGHPTISGSGKVGEPLVADAGTWGPENVDVQLTYQWLANGLPIPGAVAQAYVLSGDLLGSAVGVRVTGTAIGYESASVVSDAITVLPGTLGTGTPTITGSPTAGSMLSVDPGTWEPDDVRVTFQWMHGATPISGATASTYTVTAADRGQKINVVITGTLDGYESAAVTSTAVSVLRAFTRAPAPKISGTAKSGKTLTAARGTWAPTATSVAYQWYRNGKAIKGATKATYKLVASDGGTKITVTTTATRSGYQQTTKTSAAVSVPLNAFSKTATPKISGTAKAGATLKASKGTWSPIPMTLTYQWYRNGKAITGATKSTYKLTSTDRGKKITVKVTGQRTGYKLAAKTSKVVVVATVFSRQPTPSISGTAYVGRTVKAAVGTWSPRPTTFTYQWYRNGKAITGATKSTYKLTSADRGKKITVKVTAKRSGYESASKTSKAVTPKNAPTRANPLAGGNCPKAFPIKGNANSMIYHMPGQRFYAVTKAEDCFSTQAAAKAAGYRKAKV